MKRLKEAPVRKGMSFRRTASLVAERHRGAGARSWQRSARRGRLFAMSRALRAILVLCLASFLGAGASEGAEYPALGLDVFEPGADAELLIDAAMARAAAEQKRIVLMFGQNRSLWSRRLNDAFESDQELITRFRRDFVLVKVDVNWKKDRTMNRFTAERFDMPTRLGIPALVLLDAAGEKLAEQNTGELETPGGRDGYAREKLLALFAAWAPKR